MTSSRSWQTRLRERGVPANASGIGPLVVLSGGVVAGLPLVLPGLDVLACTASGGTGCATDDPVLLAIVPVYILAVVIVIWRMVIGGRWSMLLGALASLAVGINSVTDLAASDRTGAGLLDGLIVIGVSTMLAGVAIRLRDRRRSGTPATSP